MAKLRVDKIASVGVSTETTGSVFFDDSGDYLAIPIGTDFDLGTGDFTIETWWWREDTGTGNKLWTLGDSKTANGIQLYVGSGALKVYHNNDARLTATSLPSQQEWHHYALTRESGTLKLYVDGIQDANTYDASSADLSGSSGTGAFFYIGVESYNGSFSYAGNKFISNFRVCKGHAVYTSNFTPPTRELEVHQGPDDDRTVLLACYDGENIFADKTGRHNHEIAAYGDRTSSPTPTATDSPIGITTVSPGLIRDVDNTFGPTFQGGAAYASQNWLTLPKGTTTERFPNFAGAPASSARGLFGGGSEPFSTKLNLIEYITISTTGNAQDFGDLTVARGGIFGCSSNVRGVFAGGASPSNDNTIDFVTISTTGNAADFGDLTVASHSGSGTSNSSRGIFALGQAPSQSNNIDFITISTGGNSLKFGDLSQLRDQMGSCSSSTRGLFAGGLISPSPVSLTNIIDYVNISSTGNAVNFGDLLQGGSDGIRRCGGLSNATRGLFAGGESTPTGVKDIISFITMATLGDAQDFGDLSDGASQSDNGASSSVRGVFHLTSPAKTTLHFLTINTLGDSTDFGDMTSAGTLAGMSNGHGGLG